MRGFCLLLISILLVSCGKPLKGKILKASDFGITDPTFFGLPENYPLDPPPNQLVVSPNSIQLGSSRVGTPIVEYIIIMNSYKYDITLTGVSFDDGTDFSFVDGSCLTVPGGVLHSGEFCDLAVAFVPSAAVTRNDKIIFDYEDDESEAQTKEAALTATGTL